MICNTTGAYIKAHAEIETEGADLAIVRDATDFTVFHVAHNAITDADILAQSLVASAPDSFARDTQRELVKRFIQLAYLRGFNAAYRGTK
jgi:hypothetical protein